MSNVWWVLPFFQSFFRIFLGSAFAFRIMKTMNVSYPKYTERVDRNVGINSQQHSTICVTLFPVSDHSRLSPEPPTTVRSGGTEAQ